MSEVPFHRTRRGQEFYDRYVPELVGQLAKLSASLERIAKALESRYPAEPRPAPPATDESESSR